MQYNYNGLSKSGGIYVIFNSHNWRIYVGSTKEFKNRWIQGHTKTLQSGKHSNKFLLNDFNKCKQELGHEDFLEFHILKDMPDSTRDQRLIEEEIWIKLHFDGGKNCYNLCVRAISREGSKAKDPEVTRKLISENSKKAWANPESREKRLNLHRSDAFREKQSLRRLEVVKAYGDQDPSVIGTKLAWQDPEKRKVKIAKIKEARARQIFSPETRKKMSEVNKASGRRPPPSIKKPVRGVNVLTGEVLLFDSIREANESFHLTPKQGSISNNIRGRQTSAHGYTWTFI